MKHKLRLRIQPQPTDTSCGPTCLAAVYDYYNHPVDLVELNDQISQLDGGGTLAVHLACDALRRGFQSNIITYNLQLFDPTWFNADGEMISAEFIIEKLNQQLTAKGNRSDFDRSRFRIATKLYVDFLVLGGEVRMQPLNEDLVASILATDTPILCGLSATYLYHESRERDDGTHDDIAGDPTGHFVVLHGCDLANRSVWIADPLHPNPMAPTNEYVAPLSRVTSAILLGIVTYDANLLMITSRSN